MSAKPSDGGKHSRGESIKFLRYFLSTKNKFVVHKKQTNGWGALPFKKRASWQMGKTHQARKFGTFFSLFNSSLITPDYSLSFAWVRVSLIMVTRALHDLLSWKPPPVCGEEAPLVELSPSAISQIIPLIYKSEMEVVKQSHLQIWQSWQNILR